MFPDAEIVGAEIDKEMVDFCQRAFSVSCFLSKGDLKSLSLPRKFDLIWCGSLFTHIDERTAVALLDFFCRHLSEGGMCVFTTHGRHVANLIESKSKELPLNLTEEGRATIIRDYQRTGYGYPTIPTLQATEFP